MRIDESICTGCWECVPYCPVGAMLPEDGVSRPPSRFISVDLPEPEAPVMPTSRPRAMDSVTPRSATTSTAPVTYAFVRSLVSMKPSASMLEEKLL